MCEYKIFDGLNKFITSGYEQNENLALLACFDCICLEENNLNARFSEGFYTNENKYVKVYYVEDKEEYLYYVITLIETI